MQVTQVQVPAFRGVSNSRALAVVLSLSAVVLGFLIWLVYFKPRAGYSGEIISALPAVNAVLNSLSACFLVAGFVAIRSRKFVRHMRLMFAALVTSALFFVSYVIYHNAHGDTHFAGVGTVRPIYFSILISHIVLSAIVVPMILMTFYLSLAGKYAVHRRLARYTLPIWLYVSVTGVAVFAMLKVYNG